MTTTLTDRYGSAITTTSSAARDAYVDAVDRLLSTQPGAEAAFARALELDPSLGVAAIGRARALALHGRVAESRDAAAHARGLVAGVSRRERQHVETIALSVEGRLADALAATRTHLGEFPRDAMVLAPVTGVFGLIAFSGDLARDQHLLSLLDSMATHYGEDWWFLGLHAFASIEAGHVTLGRERVERALALNPRSGNAAHVFAHACYEEGGDDEGAKFLQGWLPSYPREGTLNCHLWWHAALFAIARGDVDAAWAIYGEHIAPGASWGPPMNALTDGASLLWRCELAGAPRRDEAWRAVRDYARTAFPRPGIPFADAHAALACAVAGDGEALAALARALRDASGVGRHPAAPVVSALADAFAAFARGDYEATITRLVPVLDEHVRIGGSRAQRDLVELTLLTAYLRAGRRADAEAIVARRPARRQRVPVAGFAPRAA
ncbi:MAG: tetratricopeptide repeat protein 38 family protein [Candidatus Rokuibacteriota bacterium]|nr:MAG: tetratricopeptide repeat protein 38 family protein [Candidatus Rokubacteria bacterium]